jgi:acetolactate synthase regulatory subunit
VFHKARPWQLALPLSVDNIERVNNAKMLGVMLSDNLNMTVHIERVLQVCSQRLYLLCQLRKQGLSLQCLDAVFSSIILSKLFYCSPVWRGFLSVEHIKMTQKYLSKAFRWELCVSQYDAVELLKQRDEALFRSTLTEGHCLHHLLPPKRSECYDFRQCSHHELTRFGSEFAKKYFVVRILYEYM